ncbi:MAG: GAF domain-containing protein [Oscillatoria sp. SIO1A7]|nr:GAF domain-containing protein [Oscillatoria sp. SIO1A7]
MSEDEVSLEAKEKAKKAMEQELAALRKRVAELEGTARPEAALIAQQKALSAVIAKIRESLDLDSIFKSTAREIRQLLDADRVGIYRFDPGSNWHEGEFVSEDVRLGYDSILGIKIYDRCFGGEYGVYYQRGRIWVVEDFDFIELHDCQRQILERLGFKANLVVPLLEREELWGLLTVHQCSRPRQWQEIEIEFVQQIALHLGVAVQQAEYVRQLQGHSDQLSQAVAQAVDREKAVTAIVDKIRRSLDLNTIFTTTVREVRQLVEADRVTIYRFNPDWSGCFVVESVASGWKSLIEEQQERPELCANISECSLKYLEQPAVIDSYLQETQGGEFNQGTVFRVANDIYKGGFSDCYIEALERYQARAYVIIAIYLGKKLWGLLAIFQNSTARDWQEAEINFLVQIGAQLGVAVQQAELLVRAESRSEELQSALTAQLQKRGDELAREAQREKALSQVIEKIRQTLDIDTIFQTATTEIRQLLGAERVGIFHFYPYSNWNEGEFISEDVLPQFDSVIAARVRDECFGEEYAASYQHGYIQAVEDIYEAGMNDCHIAILSRFQVRANLVLPLLKGEELWGLLCIHQCSSSRQWQEHEIEFVSKIALQLGVALQQAELLARARKRSVELQSLLGQVRAQKEQLTRAAEQERALAITIDKIRQSLDLETIFQTTATEVRQLLNADRVGMFRFTAYSAWNDGEFVSEDVVPPFRSALGRNIKDHCFGENHAIYYQQGRTWAANDIYALDLPDCHIAILSQFQVRANLVVPLLRGEELWGLLCIHQCSGPREWQDWEIEFVSKIAINLGVALQQAELLAQAERRSTQLQRALTEVQAQKERQAKTAEQERTLARTIERIRQTLDIDEIFTATTQEVRQILQCDRVVVYRFYPDWNGEFVFESVIPGGKPLVKEEMKTVWRDGYLQESQGGTYRDRKNTAVANIYQAGLSECHIEILELFEIKAYCVVPVFVGEKLWGLLGAYHSAEPRHWEPEEIRLLAQIGNQLGVGLNQAELLAQTKRQSRELRTTLADLQAIVDNLGDGLLVTDNAGKITRFNPALKSMFDLENRSLKGNKISEYFPPELVDLVEHKKPDDTSTSTAEVELGNNRAGQALASNIIKETEEEEEGDRCLGKVILIRDVTVEREVDRMKTDFLATVSHELRTPLTSVLGFASIIKDKLEEVILPRISQDDRKLQKALVKVGANIDIIVSEAERLTALINDVLDIAKMEAGRVEWHIEIVEPTEILDRAIAATSSLFEHNNLELIKDFAPSLPPVAVDCDRMIQVVINLISNAVKFTEAGSVTCRATANNDELVVEIIDTGIGIAPEDRDRVFERFKQVGDLLTEKPKGTGLGLPICKQIVEYHGGRIWVESELDKGSVFSFSIPLESSQYSYNIDSLLRELKQQVATTTKAKVLERVELGELGLASEASTKIVLVVDDDPSIRELLRQSLEEEGYEVREAQNGMEAISLAKAIAPDLVILDVKIPQIDGFDVAAVLKNDPQTMQIPIIILSIVEDRQRGYRVGVDRYLTKPIDKSELLGEIGLLLEQGRSAKTVLIVDRNALVVKTLSDALLAQGYKAVEASDGWEGLQKAKEVKPDLIIIDSALSQEIDLVKTLRFTKDLENVSLIFLGDRVIEKDTES